MFVTVTNFQPSPIFADKARAWVEPSQDPTNKGKLQDFPTNIRLGWKCLSVTNTVAYSDTAFITYLKRFIVQALQNYWLSSRKIVLKLVRPWLKRKKMRLTQNIWSSQYSLFFTFYFISFLSKGDILKKLFTNFLQTVNKLLTLTCVLQAFNKLFTNF